MVIKLSTRSSLEIGMQEDITVKKIDNRPFERVEDFKYLGTTLMYQNSIQ
jgi:hypothetical protein